MKKFLSVLLVIAVMFTFSFTTALAATNAEAKAYLQNAYNAALTQIEPEAWNYDGIKVNDPDTTTFEISKAAMQAAVTKVYEKEAEALGTNNASSLLGVGIDSKPESVIQAELVEAFKAAAKVDSDAVKESAKVAAPAYKAMLLGLVDKVDTTKYSTKAKKTKAYGDGEVYDNPKAAADADKEYAKKLINDLKDDEDALNNGWSAFLSIIKITENKDNLLDTTLTTSLTYGLLADDISTPATETSAGYYLTKSQEASEEAINAASKASAKANLAKAIAAYKGSPAYKAVQDDQINAYKETMEYLIDNEDGFPYTADFTIVSAAADSLNSAYTGANDFVRITVDAKAVDRIAQEAKAATFYNGEKMYDDKKIDENIGKEKIKAYQGVHASKPRAVADADIEAALTGGAINKISSAQKADYKYAMDSDIDAADNGDDTYTFGGKTYYEKEFDAIKAAADKYKAAVDAAKTIDDENEAKKQFDKEIKDLKDVAAVDTELAKVDMAKLSALNPYWDAVASSAGLAPNKIFVAVDGENYDNTKADIAPAALLKKFAKDGARTAAEAEAMIPAVKKAIDSYKTADDFKADAKKVNDDIAALPANPTLADKDSVVAAKKAFDKIPADAKMHVTNESKLNKALEKVEAAEANKLAQDLNALTDPSKVTPKDKEAVNAAKEALDKFMKEKAYTGVPAYAGHQTALNGLYDFTKALNNIQDAEFDEIQKQYNDLRKKAQQGKLSAEDKPAVDALKKAIADYVADYPGSHVSALSGIESFLNEFVETMVGGDAVHKVESIQLKASSTVKKGSITVKWRFTNGVKEDCDAYEVWRSTKRNKGFKKMYTTTSNTKLSYKNTKGLKKGTRYYFKVRAIKYIDGVKYKSDWSNKAFRKAK